MITVTVVSSRAGVKDESYMADLVPRIGDAISTSQMALARVTDVTWRLGKREVTVYAG